MDDWPCATGSVNVSVSFSEMMKMNTQPRADVLEANEQFRKTFVSKNTTLAAWTSVVTVVCVCVCV